MITHDYALLSKLLKGAYIGDHLGEYYGVINGDTKSLDYGSYGFGVGSNAAVLMVASRSGTGKKMLTRLAAGHCRALKGLYGHCGC